MLCGMTFILGATASFFALAQYGDWRYVTGAYDSNQYRALVTKVQLQDGQIVQLLRDIDNIKCRVKMSDYNYYLKQPC